MKVFITGAAGRLGRAAAALLAPEHALVGLDARERPDDWPAGAPFVAADLRNADAVRAAADGAEVVVHLGAIPGRVDYMPQADLFAVNVQGTFHVLEAAANAGARMVVLASSLCAVGLPASWDDHTLDYLPLDEDHPCRPCHAYDLSKRVNEIQADAFTRMTGIATVCLRFPMLAHFAGDAWFAEHMAYRPPQLVLADCLDYTDAARAIDAALRRRDLTHHVLFLHADTAGMIEPTPAHLRRFRPAVPWKGPPPTGTSPLISDRRARELLGWRPLHTWQQDTAVPAEP